MKQMIDNVICGDIEFVINQINKIYLNDGDLNGVLEDIINELEKNIFKKNLNDKNYQSVLSKMIEIYDKMKKSSVNNKIIFEMGILEYCTNQQKIISREIILPQKECQKETSNTSVDKIESNFEEKNDGMDVDETEFKNIRINNTFANANKEFLNQIKNKWSELSEHAFDKEYGAVICSLMDGTPVAASDNYVIITYPHHIETIKINRDYTNFENVINKFLKSKYNIVAITEEEWNNAKKEYITKLNSKENYLLVNDKFIQEDEQIISREIISHSNVSEIIEKNSNSDNKIFELFDSKYIDIK